MIASTISLAIPGRINIDSRSFTPVLFVPMLALCHVHKQA